MKEIKVYELKSVAGELRAGDTVSLSGTVYTARDAAHKRIIAMLEKGEKPPFDIEGAVVYYAGPTPAKNGLAVGSCGPTTSSRMNPYAPVMLECGMAGIIGKGQMSDEVREALKKHGAVYFCAVGGAGALAAKAIKKCEVVAFDDLGCESVKRIEIENFSLIVGIDAKGKSIFER